MKFGLVVPQEFHEHYRRHSFEISGLLQWARVLQGDVLTVNEDLTPYDVLMTNVSSTETEYISVIRQENPDATILTCFDYGFDVVNQYFTNLERVCQVMRRADHIFSVNKNQQLWMKELLPERTVHYVPHPTDVEQMLKFRKRLDQRDAGVAAMWHQYDNYQIQSLEILKLAEKRLGQRFQKVLIGLKPRWMKERGISVVTEGLPVVSDDHPDPQVRGKVLDDDLEAVTQRGPSAVGWSTVLPYLGVEAWYDALSRFRAAIDMYTVSSIGRFGIDCAGVAVPCVASNRQDSGEVLWPQTRVSPYIPGPAVAELCSILRNDSFSSHILQKANERLGYFGFEQSRERILKVLETKPFT